MELGIDRKKTDELISKYIKDPITRLHLLESEAVMKALARRFGEDEEKWGIIGLLHDIDWDLTKNDNQNHCIKVVEILKEAGASDFLIQTIQSHGYSCGIDALADKQRDGLLQHSLAAAETVTGLIVASTLILPDKKLASLTIESLKKKFKDKKFAAKCNREIILECEKTKLILEEFLEISLKALQEIHDQLGL